MLVHQQVPEWMIAGTEGMLMSSDMQRVTFLSDDCNILGFHGLFASPSHWSCSFSSKCDVFDKYY